MKSKYFQVHEFVPRKMFNKYGEQAWRYVDIRLIETMDLIRERFPLGIITINNYFWGGNRLWSGIRTSDSPDYSYGSQHSFANALDFVCSAYSADMVRSDIIMNQDIYKHVRGLEMNVSWCHLDVRNEDRLIQFSA